jgi:simple sugar transport system ATP-binding protein/ribose transport system ATP-binding protein
MLGRPLNATFPPPQPPAADAPVVLRVDGLSATGVEEVSFELHAGEILGLAGLVGAGRTELARAVYGAARRSRGDVVLEGKPLGRLSPRRSILSGVTMIPESRKDDGLIFGRSTIENATISRLDELTTLGFVHRRKERLAATEVLDRCGVHGARYTAPVGQLSGGNQQKVLLARTLLCGPRVVIADEPTRGVDVGAKRAIYDFLGALAGEGLGVLLISSELEEVIGLSHRVLVMRRGRVVDELAGDGITEAAILGAAFGERA